MSLQRVAARSLKCVRIGLVSAAMFQFTLGGPLPSAAQSSNDQFTRTPIKHVIVIVGENRTFDHIFATYKPKASESVDNLLSKGIIKDDGSPGPNYSLANQYSADIYRQFGLPA